MNWLKLFYKKQAFRLTVSKAQEEVLEFFLANKTEFEKWILLHPHPKVRFQFFYPTAIDFYFSDFKLFTAYFKKGRKGDLELTELKMSEMNFDTIRCASWQPFEEIIIDFLNSLQENKKITLLEQRKMLYEYANLCAKKPSDEGAKDFFSAVASLLPRSVG